MCSVVCKHHKKENLKYILELIVPSFWASCKIPAKVLMAQIIILSSVRKVDINLNQESGSLREITPCFKKKRRRKGEIILSRLP